MTAKQAVDFLREAMKTGLDADVSKAICLLIDHTRDLEQALDLIVGATDAASRNVPPPAILRRARWERP